jgi:hypothetical protein
LKEGDLARGNQVIDEAAVGAGRDPREISRLLNIHGAFTTASQGFLQGPSGQWVEDLLPLVLEQGVSSFILMADDLSTIQHWGGDVAPALREALERERDEAGTPEAGGAAPPKSPGAQE